MKTTPPLRLLVAVPLGVALAAGVAAAGPRPDPARGYASAAPSGSAAELPPEPKPEVVAGHKPWVPAFDVAVPETPSAAPSREEWASASPAPEVRVTQPHCDVKRVREYYRVTCTSETWIALISGTRAGVTFGCAKTHRGDEQCSENVSVEFPARRGDRRAFELFAWGKWGPSPDAILTEQFLPGDPGPQISLQGARWGL
jgi:hypothetical protein